MSEHTPTGPSVPLSLVRAVQLMYAGAVASAVFAVVGLTQRSAVHTALEQQNAKLPAAKRYTASQLNQITTSSITFSVTLGVICVALWLWMARVNFRTRPWGRTVATILGGLGVLSFVFSTASAGSIIGKALGGVVALIGIGTVFLMWRPDASRFYAEQAKHRREV